MTAGGVTYTRPAGTVPYADTDRYKGGFGVPSDRDPGKVYKVAYDTAAGYWVCSCPGGVHHGYCKHLERYGRIGRRDATKAAQDSRRRRARPVPEFAPPPPDARPLPPMPKSLLVPSPRGRRLALGEEI
jgi:hypothetical protein